MTIPSLSMQGAAVRMPARFTLVAAAIAATFCQAAVAEEKRLEETVVTAARSETKLDETLADVRVINKDQIASSGGRSLAELLQRFAGVQIVSYGGRGLGQSIRIRGSDQVVLLVDGVRFTSQTMGTPTLASLSIESIERIEVVHGPASALYGSDAIGGVVQIFTKRGLGAKSAFIPSASVTYGYAGYKDAQAGFIGQKGAWDYSLSISRVLEPNSNVTNENEPWGAYEDDIDSYRQTAINASIGLQLTNDWRLAGNISKSDNNVDLDGYVANEWQEIKASTSQIKLTGKLNNSWESSLSASSMTDQQSNF